MNKGDDLVRAEQKTRSRTIGSTKYLSPLAVWALAFGCSVGWGAFVMPGSTFLPIGGPLGTALGLLIGATVMVVFGFCYSCLMKRYPDAGGIYTFSKRVLGSDHGFLCAWMLFLTYSAVIWANSTALALIVRGVFGDVFRFGFSYDIAGYTVYFGEVLLSIAIIALTCAICAVGRRLVAWIQIICSLTLFLGITVVFAAALIKNGGFAGIKPLFAAGSDPVVQVFSIVVLAPWAFIGFESISHSAAEFRFPVKRSMIIMAAALLAGFLSYTMLTCCAAMAVPDGFESWTDYISSLSGMGGAQAIPTFYAAQESLGTAGLYVLMVAAICGVVTGLIANYVALSRLLFAASREGAAPKRIGRLNRFGTPYVAVILVAAVSAVMPFFGRTAIGWIVDVTTIGASIIYAYVSITTFIVGRREKNLKAQAAGIVGAIIAAAFFVEYLLPVNSFSRITGQDYLILAVWCILGMIVFRFLLYKDSSRAHGKSGVVWIVLVLLVLMISAFWISESVHNSAELIGGEIGAYAAQGNTADSVQQFVTQHMTEYSSHIIRNIVILMSLLTVSIIVIFSIFAAIKKREKLIEAQRIAAEENSRAKSAFLSNMSHDIRTPMNAVTGYTTLALQEKDIPDKIRGYLENIDTSGKHMLGIINDILDMSRIESGKMELDTAPEDIVGMLEDVELIFRHQMEVKSLDFTVEFRGVKDRYIICDRHRINRVLLNLISNACKFTHQGGFVKVTLTETAREGDDCAYTLSVKDNGIGMSPEFAEKVFDSFERERSDTVNKIQGTGLGMSITKRLVELMGGSIRVVTEKGKGTEFIIDVSFPAASEDEIRILTEEAAGGTYDFTGKRLLLVEDNPINTEIARMLLEHEGFVIETAEDGKAALDAVAAAEPDRFDAVLMDIQMPVMNGYEAAAAIRALPAPRCDIPIIAMTANTFDDDIRKAHEAGMDAHIAKPIEIDDMLETLAETLEG